MKTLIATFTKTVACIGMAPLFPMIAITWVFAALVDDSAQANEGVAPAKTASVNSGYRTESQIIMLNATA